MTLSQSRGGLHPHPIQHCLSIYPWVRQGAGELIQRLRPIETSKIFPKQEYVRISLCGSSRTQLGTAGELKNDDVQFKNP
jgi:hypothetical protein